MSAAETDLKLALGGALPLTPEEARYGAVVADIVNIMNAGIPRATFGDAMDVSLEHRELPDPPPKLKAAILITAYRIVVTGKIPGAPDA